MVNSKGELSKIIEAHYLRKAYMSNAFKALLSWNTLGNINMLVTDVGTGVKDFFYEPYQGYIKGPAEGTKGLIRGSMSLVGNTTKGTIGTVGRIFGSVSNGILVLADDKEYINTRQGNSVRDGKPENVYQGLRDGLKCTVNGVTSGLKGLYQEPIRGAQQNGVVKGFLKGSVKGIGGVIIKPTSGVLDFIAKTSQGTESMFQRKPKQIEQPQQIEPSGQNSDNPYAESRPFQASQQHSGTEKIRALRPLFSSSGQLRQFSSLDSRAYFALHDFLNQAKTSSTSAPSKPRNSASSSFVPSPLDPAEESYEGMCLLNDNLAFIMSDRRLLVFEYKDDALSKQPHHQIMVHEVFSIEISEGTMEEKEYGDVCYLLIKVA